MTILELKAAVRERDGNRCTECSMTNFEHVLTYGFSLDVHRLEPGSKYTVDGCKTLCRGCHGPKPKTPRGRGRKWAVEVDPEVKVALMIAATVRHISISKMFAEIMREQLAAEIAEIRASA